MPLIVPILRAAYVFSNVFETFKTLRPPPPSARNGGQPSVRAMSQRKRAMKGCMAVWLCWCCFIMYERTVDGFVRVFIPFYDEIKSLVILFFLFSRARGAEPIFLHVLRPVIKPYASTLDLFLEIGSSVGDFLLLAASIPIRFVLDRWRKWTHSAREHFAEDNVQDKQPEDVVPAFLREAPTKANSARPQTRRNGSSNSSSRDRGSQRSQTQAQHAFIPITTSSNPPAATRTSRASRIYREPTQGPPPPPYERWYPPASTYGNDEPPVVPPQPPHIDTSGLPTPPADSPPPFEEVQREVIREDAEWRQYPAFPSAYPPTPLQTSAPRLPSAGPSGSVASPALMRAPQFAAGILEEGGSDDERDETVRQGFRESLPLPREFVNPDSAGDSSDYNALSGIQNGCKASSDEDVYVDDQEDEAMSSSDDLEDSEDDFDVTLRTPRRMRVCQAKEDTIKAKVKTRGLASTSEESFATTSTKLSTTDNGSSLRTRSRTNSEVSSGVTQSGSDVSSIAGRKRRIASAIPQARTRVKAATKGKADAKPERLRKTKAVAVRPSAVQLHSRMRAAARQHNEGASETAETDSDLSDSGETSDLKRRRVPGLPGEREGLARTRPTVVRGESGRTIRGRRAGDAVASKNRTGEAAQRPSASRRRAAGTVTEDAQEQGSEALGSRPTRTGSRSSTRSRH